MTCNVYVMHVITCNNILGVSLMQWPIQVGGTGHSQSQYGPGSRQSRSRAAVSHTGSTACSHISETPTML